MTNVVVPLVLALNVAFVPTDKLLPLIVIAAELVNEPPIFQLSANVIVEVPLIVRLFGHVLPFDVKVAVLLITKSPVPAIVTLLPKVVLPLTFIVTLAVTVPVYVAKVKVKPLVAVVDIVQFPDPESKIISSLYVGIPALSVPVDAETDQLFALFQSVAPDLKYLFAIYILNIYVPKKVKDVFNGNVEKSSQFVVDVRIPP
jgi:hypothetical protein